MSIQEWNQLRRNEVGDICSAPQRRFQPGLYGDHIALLSNTEKFKRAILDAAHDLPVAVGRRLLTLTDSQHIGIVLGTLALWVGSHFFGIGEAVDVVPGGVALVTLGWDGICALRDVAAFGRGVIGARTDQELHAAARHLTHAVTVLGVDTLMVLLLRRAHLRARALREIRSETKETGIRRGVNPQTIQPSLDSVAEKKHYDMLVRKAKPRTPRYPLTEKHWLNPFIGELILKTLRLPIIFAESILNSLLKL